MLVVLLCGLPGAGKTTFSKYFVQERPENYTVDYFCFDDMFPAFQEAQGRSSTEAFQPEHWHDLRCHVYEIVKRKAVEMQQQHPVASSTHMCVCHEYLLSYYA